MLNHIGKMPNTHYKKEFCNGFTGKSQWFNGISMETTDISVMVCIGLLLFFFTRVHRLFNNADSVFGFDSCG